MTTDAFVVDASVALAWCFTSEASPRTDRALRRLERSGALAPSIWELEVSNALLSGERRGRLSAAEVSRKLGLLLALPIHIVRASTDPERLVDVARRHQLTTYDAAYLALAAHEGLPLATSDRALERAARDAGVILALD